MLWAALHTPKGTSVVEVLTCLAEASALSSKFSKICWKDNKQHGKNLTVQPGDLGLFEISASSQASQVTASLELTPLVLLSKNVNQGNHLTFQCNFLPLVMLSMESRWLDSHIVQRGSHTVFDPVCLQWDNSSAGLPVFTQCSFSLCPQNSLSK